MKPLLTHIRAKPTALGNSVLYHQIYFNFVTFAIIWIPLVLLLIFNSILISYVRRSKQEIQQNLGGVELRRHNRGSQGEQRKTTIMLIAVVLVFTVCQIPQAISLTVLSIFPKLARTSQVLIYNNFANCLVAVNASINFVLYCCFSERFRSTFRSNFSFLSKYCAQYINPEWTKKSTTHRSSCMNSLDDISQVNNSNPGCQLNTRISNISTDGQSKYFNRLNSYKNQSIDKDERIWFLRFSFCSPTVKSRTKKIKSNDSQISLRMRSIHSSPTINSIKTPTNIVRQAPIFNFPSVADNRPLKSSFARKIPEKISTIPSKQSSYSFPEVNSTILKSKFHPRSYSYRSLPNNEQIWIKRIRSDQDLTQRTSFLSKEILDVTV
ncbi:hypothetical protein I4U23_014096 [Adineta vaga]|nr:hypothetical protein I4U23_014096 [Adineta vaga]